MIGRITRVPLRTVWKHEALDFTSWLQENMDVLVDVLGFAPQNAEREQAAGAFSVLKSNVLANGLKMDKPNRTREELPAGQIQLQSRSPSRNIKIF